MRAVENQDFLKTEMFLDLQMTTNLYNDSPFAGPMTDVQAYWENPFRSDVQ